ncbi:hypothetical protein ACHQM5_005430 [Ranunculus cassubicifolius]
MFTDKDNSKDQFGHGGTENSDRKNVEFRRKSDMDHDGGSLNSSKIGNLGSQELTLSYLCENFKMGIQEKEVSGKNFLSNLEKGGSSKGKEVILDNGIDDERWVERDFLQLNGVSGGGSGGSGSKRDIEDDDEKPGKEKKPKLETLNLSLGLPDVSLSLASPIRMPKADTQAQAQAQAQAHHVVVMPSRSNQSLGRSNNNTRTGSSDDFTGAASMSYSFSHQFSHNPSCSLTRNSTDFYEYNCGEGTNGSVHSRFKPVGDSVVLSNYHAGVGNSSMQGGNWPVNKDSGNNSLYRGAGSENISFFPSDLPARPMKETQSNDSRGRGSDRHRVVSDGGARARKLSRPERLLREVVTESVTVMAQIFQELPDEAIGSAKEYLKSLIGVPEKGEELLTFQNRLERRSDFTLESLSKSHKAQMDILVAIKTGLPSYLSVNNRLPVSELAEIFLFLRCRNINCKGLLPVDDCDCKICTTKKGFCSACMCPVCLKFDYANNTCSWVGCDVCSHWCHAVCGTQKNLIKPGSSLRGSTGTTEMHFHCPGCDHASEMFGFVKDVFLQCAEGWSVETLMKELDYVRKIFRGSEDSKGKELHNRAEQMLGKLENKMVSPSDASNCILQFFKYGNIEYSASASSSKDLPAMSSQKANLVSASPLASKSPSYNALSSSVQRDMMSLRDDAKNSNLKSLMSERTAEEELQNSILSKNGFNSLESVVRIKEAEARMFQSKADDARREAERFRRMVRASNEKLEEEYTAKLAQLCLQETEERRRKKLEELKALENSHCDYYNMKIRMQAEIAGLLERMEATKQQCV